MPRPRVLLAVLVPLLALLGLTTPAQAAWPTPVPVVSKVTTDDPVVFITIDDGWAQSPAAAKILRDRNVPASLFLVSDAASYGVPYFRNLLDHGPSRVENHTVTHPYLSSLDLAGQRAEICGARQRALSTFGLEPRLLRPPYGDYNEDTRIAAGACGAKALVTWTHDFTTWGSWQPPTPQLQAGDIILLHFTDDLPADLNRALAAADAAGLKPARLRDYIAD
ncbi:polysaccharide deacetylase family protein [Streptomyces sp. NPDC005953]|uniref:polysaccharide deacetylase family protein n=1 Tax=unclassified Streptomyces TaxID=2593676 RepID=UPI0033EF8858